MHGCIEERTRLGHVVGEQEGAQARVATGLRGCKSEGVGSPPAKGVDERLSASEVDDCQAFLPADAVGRHALHAHAQSDRSLAIPHSTGPGPSPLPAAETMVRAPLNRLGGSGGTRLADAPLTPTFPCLTLLCARPQSLLSTHQIEKGLGAAMAHHTNLSIEWLALPEPLVD